MTIETFNRIENKYLMESPEYNFIKAVLNYEMAYDQNQSSSSYKICNIYYDTVDDYLIKYSLSKPVFKEKLRLRCYGDATLDSLVFIELKKKINGVVNKRRSQILLSDAYKMIETKELPKEADYHNRMVLKEIQCFLNRYELLPSTYVSYDRCAYSQGEFRVTIDSNIITRKTDLFLENGSYGDQLLKDGFVLLEAKSAKAFPMWFVHLLSSLRVYKTSFSKFGKDYIRRSKNINEKGVLSLCLTQCLVTHQNHQLHY